jgi:hypothetical protein
MYKVGKCFRDGGRICSIAIAEVRRVLHPFNSPMHLSLKRGFRRFYLNCTSKPMEGNKPSASVRVTGTFAP